MSEDKDEKAFVDIAALDIHLLLGVFINLLSIKAWQHMGLRVNPQTGKVDKDMGKARTAVDCIAFLIDKLEPQVDSEEKNKLRGLLTDLQLNFVQQGG